MGTFLRVVGGAILVTTYFLPAVSCGPARYSEFQAASQRPGPWGIVAFLALLLIGIWTVLGPMLHPKSSRIGEAVQMTLTVAAAGGVGYFIYAARQEGCEFLWPIGAQIGALFIAFIGSLLRFRSRARW